MYAYTNIYVTYRGPTAAGGRVQEELHRSQEQDVVEECQGTPLKPVVIMTLYLALIKLNLSIICL